MATWDPTTYLRFADERSRPFVDLTAAHRCPRAPRSWSTWAAAPGS